MKPKRQFNVRMSEQGGAILDALIEHFTATSSREAGRKTTQAEVIERALRLLASREKISKNVRP